MKKLKGTLKEIQAQLVQTWKDKGLETSEFKLRNVEGLPASPRTLFTFFRGEHIKADNLLKIAKYLGYNQITIDLDL